MFYLKLAWNNIKASKRAYAPFMLASFVLYSFTCAIFLILTSPMADSMGTAMIILPLGIFVLAILSTIMEIYSYNVLLKQRSKEFGLYNILGMNKKQVGFVSILELGIIFLFLIVLGSVFSGIFANLLYLIFVNIINYDKLILTLSPLGFILNIILFAGIFFVLALSGLRQIRQTSPLDLFKSSEKGEKEPQGNMVLALLSLLFLGGGYGISLYSKNLSAFTVIMYFFVAVILVILGTYLFYISFMAWYLKKKRSNKAYFYQPRNFITTSQMIFRMKANATGLASITLLAVMAFVSIGTTVALYANTKNLADTSFPKEVKVSGQAENYETGGKAAESRIREVLGQDANVISYTSSLISVPLTNSDELTVTKEEALKPTAQLAFLIVMTQDDFRKLGNNIPQLTENQALFYTQNGKSHYKKMTLIGQKFDIVDNLKTVNQPDVTTLFNGAILVVSDVQTAEGLKNAFSEVTEKMTTIQPTYSVIFDATEDQRKALGLVDGQAFLDGNGEALGYVQTRQAYLDEGYAMFGGMLFTGVLLGISFLLGAALIIYYKQYSEGQEDKKSYKILQEVGMSKEGVKKTISSQVLLVFFMPLGFAALHYLIAIPMLRQMLLFFGVTSSNLVYLVAGMTMLVIAIAYFGIYKATSRTYYKLVER